MWVIHHCTWMSDPDFNKFLTGIIFSFLFSEHFSFLLVSFTLLSPYLSKPLTVTGLGPSWAIPAQTSAEAGEEKLNGVKHTKVGSIPSATSSRIEKKIGSEGYGQDTM